MIEPAKILSLLPYQRPFLFVDKILQLDESRCRGTYYVREDEYFFEGHFPGHPVVPGVILTEVMAQIGLVVPGIFLLLLQGAEGEILPAFTSAEVEFLKPVPPKTTLTVESEKIYFRFNKLKCKVHCRLPDGSIAASGQLAGMIINKQN